LLLLLAKKKYQCLLNLNDMLYLIFGPELFLSHEKLNLLKQRFEHSSTQAAFSLHVLDFSEENLGEAIRILSSLPFLMERRLLILRGFLGNLKEREAKKIKGLLEDVDNDKMIVVFYEEGELKKVGLTKWLMNNSTVFYASYLTPAQKEKWLCERFKGKGQLVDKEVIRLLILFNEDLWALSQEVDKLIASGRPINLDLVRRLVCGRSPTRIFDITDQLLARDFKSALAGILKLLEKGEPASRLLGMLHFYLSSLLLVKALKEKEKTGATKAIATTAGLHPYVFKKISGQVDKWSEDRVKKYLLLLSEADQRLKTTSLAPGLLMTDLMSCFENTST